MFKQTTTYTHAETSLIGSSVQKIVAEDLQARNNCRLPSASSNQALSLIKENNSK